MINEILKPTGIPFKETQFSRAPTKDYAVYHDEVTADGADDENLIFTHDITLELYEVKPNPSLENLIESELNRRGLKWQKQSRYWVEGAQRFQVIYEFSYITKT